MFFLNGTLLLFQKTSSLATEFIKNSIGLLLTKALVYARRTVVHRFRAKIKTNANTATA
jgi:hypothetical protein